MASWKKVLTDGDNTNIANADLTSNGGTRRFYLGQDSDGAVERLWNITQSQNNGTRLVAQFGTTAVNTAHTQFTTLFNTVNIKGVNSQAPKFRIYEASGTSYTAIAPADDVTANYTIKLPATTPVEVGEVLTATDTGGTLGWGAASFVDVSNVSFANGDYRGETIEHGSMRSGVSYTAGNVYILTADGWTNPSVTSTVTEDDLNGLCGLAIGTSPTNGGFLLRGTYKAAADIPGSGEHDGSILYLSSTGYTTTKPTAAGSGLRIAGYCLSDTDNTIYFSPSPDYIILE